MDMTHPLAQHYDRVNFISTAFFMTYTSSSDYEIMQLLNTGGTLCVLPNVTTQKGDYKGALQVSPKVSVELAWIETGIFHSV